MNLLPAGRATAREQNYRQTAPPKNQRKPPERANPLLPRQGKPTATANTLFYHGDSPELL
ncbi:MAG: hypothetical protein ACPHL6_00345 [Rubripirellula sp.]